MISSSVSLGPRSARLKDILKTGRGSGIHAHAREPSRSRDSRAVTPECGDGECFSLSRARALVGSLYNYILLHTSFVVRVGTVHDNVNFERL